MLKRKLQVFVSSTFSDLKAERQAAVSAILKAGHIPAGMELFKAGDKSQLDTIKRWIDESDVYMLILGGRYGSIEPASGLSYTEVEFEYAVSKNKPLFSVVIKEDSLERKVKEVGSGVIEKENPQKLKIFRERVLSNISSFFSDEKDIQICVHESLADKRDDAAIKGWVSGADVEDVGPLRDEIAKLRAENERLQVDLDSAQAKSTKNNNLPTIEDFRDIVNVLNKTEITIPADANKGKSEKSTLFKIFLSNQEILINGITDSNLNTSAATFLYNVVFPKLILHGLAVNERIPDSRLRRSFVNAAGASVLSAVEHSLSKAKKSLPKVNAPTSP